MAASAGHMEKLRQQGRAPTVVASHGPQEGGTMPGLMDTPTAAMRCYKRHKNAFFLCFIFFLVEGHASGGSLSIWDWLASGGDSLKGGNPAGRRLPDAHGGSVEEGAPDKA